MRIGVAFPQVEIGPDPGAVREFVQAVEDLGFAYLFIGEHVLGADPEFHRDMLLRNQSRYDHRSPFHEPFPLMGYLAAITERLELSTGVLVLPQRQTALVAKQAAEVDVLSRGRLRLAVGVGWNPVEFEALGQDFHTRGRRMEEQIAVLRALWTQEVVTFNGRWHQITSAGLNPLPVQRPIPIWIGVGASTDSPVPADRPLRRVVRMADGWIPIGWLLPNEAARDTIGRLHGFAREAGRDPASIGMECRINAAHKGPEEWSRELKAWEELGVGRIVFETRRGGLRSLDEHIDAIRRFKEVVDG